MGLREVKKEKEWVVVIILNYKNEVRPEDDGAYQRSW